MANYTAGQQSWAGTQDAHLAYPPAEEPAGWPFARGHGLASRGVPPQPTFQASVPPRPAVLPPGELDTVTGPISLSTSARRDRAAEPQGGGYGHSYEGYRSHPDPAGHGRPDYSGGHGYPPGGQAYADGYGYGYPNADGGYAADSEYADDTDYAVLDDGSSYDDALVIPAVPLGTTFVAATPAARSARGTDTRAFDTGADQETRTPGRRGAPGGGSTRAKGEKSEGAQQRAPGAHRAPLGRPGSARAKLAIASTASLAGLSALVGSAVLATDTGPLTIPAGPGGGTSTGQFPAVQSSGSGADSSAASASSPITPGLTPAVPVIPLVPNQSDSSDAGDGYLDAAAGYDPTLEALAPTYDGTYDPTVDTSTDSSYPTDGLGSGGVPIIPLTPRDVSAPDPTTGTPATTAADQPPTEGSVFNWFGIGTVPETEAGTPSPSPTASPGQDDTAPPPDATTDPTTAPSRRGADRSGTRTGTGTGTGIAGDRPGFDHPAAGHGHPGRDRLGHPGRLHGLDARRPDHGRHPGPAGERRLFHQGDDRLVLLADKVDWFS